MIDLVKINDMEHMQDPPLGLLYIGDALKKSGYEVRVLHYPSEDIIRYAREVVKNKPLFVAFSVFTANGIRSTANMCREIKRLSDIPIVWGNAHPTLLREQCLNEPYIDIVVFGEGEETVVELAQAIEKGQELKDIRGIGYKENGEVRFTKARPFIENLDKFRANWSLIDVNKYVRPTLDSQRVLPFVTSRGCPHNCAFCYNQVFNRRKWRAHSIDFVVSEIRKLKSEYDIDGVTFQDDNFFVNKKRAFEIAKKIELGYSADARIDYVDEEFCEKLKETNCKVIMFGIESGSDRILKLMNKDFVVSDIIKAVKNLTKVGIGSISGSIIIGYPTETRSEFLETMKLVIQLLEINPRMAYTTGLYLPYPGTPSYELAIECGFEPPRETEEWDGLDRWAYGLNVSWVDWITASEVPKIRKYVQATSILFDLNIPIFKKLAKYRLTAGNYFMDYDMRLWVWLRSNYLYGNPIKLYVRLINRLIKKIGSLLKRRRPK